jgi:hypothetical protein
LWGLICVVVRNQIKIISTSDSEKHIFADMKLLDLPDEIIRAVASNLYGDDVAQLGSTCRSLFRVTSDQWLWRLMFVKQFKVLPDDADSITQWKALYARRYWEGRSAALKVMITKYMKTVPMRRQLAPIVNQTLRPRFELILNGFVCLFVCGVLLTCMYARSVAVEVPAPRILPMASCLVVPIPKDLPRPSASLVSALRRSVTVRPAAAAALLEQVTLRVEYKSRLGRGSVVCESDPLTWTPLCADKVVRARRSPDGHFVLCTRWWWIWWLCF